MTSAEAAARAAVTVAAAHGLTGVTPEVLSDGSNVLLRLAPAPVVARVATSTALARPGSSAPFARDLALAAYLTGLGAPVVAPSSVLPPGPHRQDGLALSFWEYVPHEPGHPFEPAEFAGLLAELHAALRDYPGELPLLPSLDVEGIAALLRGREIAPDSLLDSLVADSRRILATLAASELPVRALHGDAHPGNVLFTAHGPCWTDFEDTWRGPVEWDLACLARTQRLDGLAAVAAYPSPPDPQAFAPYLAARRVQGVAWSLLLADRFPARRAAARTWLTAYHSEHTPT